MAFAEEISVDAAVVEGHLELDSFPIENSPG